MRVALAPFDDGEALRETREQDSADRIARSPATCALTAMSCPNENAKLVRPTTLATKMRNTAKIRADCTRDLMRGRLNFIVCFGSTGRTS